MTTTHTTPVRGDGETTFWPEHTTIALQPVAPPSILGLYGFAAPTFAVAANLAGWYGNSTTTPSVLFPFVLAVGGIAQLLAGMWAYRARDGLATAMHGIWGSFWMAFGVYQLLVAVRVLPGWIDPGAASAFGIWFAILAAITWVAALAASAESTARMGMHIILAAGSTLLAIGLLSGTRIIQIVGAYFLIASALLAWYIASAMLLNHTFKRTVLPLGKRAAVDSPADPGRRAINYPLGEPGVMLGQ